MRVTQHVPTFIELEEARFEGEIGSVNDLTKKSFVRNFWVAPGFYRFVRTPYLREDSFLLMAEFEGGKRFYVVATMEGSDVKELTRALPDWEEPA